MLFPYKFKTSKFSNFENDGNSCRWLWEALISIRLLKKVKLSSSTSTKFLSETSIFTTSFGNSVLASFYIRYPSKILCLYLSSGIRGGLLLIINGFFEWIALIFIIEGLKECISCYY